MEDSLYLASLLMALRLLEVSPLDSRSQLGSVKIRTFPLGGKQYFTEIHRDFLRCS